MVHFVQKRAGKKALHRRLVFNPVEVVVPGEEIWFPSMSVRRERPVVLYNKFE